MTYALVDCNSFFCSCERVFRPDLWNRPIAVLSSNDGCFVSCTRDVKALGIKIGSPYFKSKDLCLKHNVKVFSSNFSLYTDMSERVMTILSRYSPAMEVYSVDEAFLNLSSFSHHDLHSYAMEIKESVFKLTGIPVSIGIAKTKTLAKAANSIAKSDKNKKGVSIILTEKEVDECLKKMSTFDIWGIGKQSGLKLRSLNIKTASDFKNYKNIKTIKRILGKGGLDTQYELLGNKVFGPRERKIKKSLQSSRTFGGVVSDVKTMRESIAKHVTTVCERLRSQESCSENIEIQFATTPYRNGEQHFVNSSISFGTSRDTSKIIKNSLQAVEDLFKVGMEYKKSGVTLSHISDDSTVQLNLFEERDSVKTEKLMEAIDRINLKEGDGTLTFAACGTNDSSLGVKTFCEHKSPRYQSSWKELLKLGISSRGNL